MEGATPPASATATTPDAPSARSAPAGRPAVVVLSSLVARGSVGGRAVVFALERMGFPVWFLPTVLLPWHPGHGRASRHVPPADAFAALAADLARAPWLGEVGAVLTGYFGSAEQVEAAASLVAAIKAARPDALYLCDPVIGDQKPDGSGGLYLPEATAIAIRDRLMPLADIATPNRFEAGWLSGLPVGSTAEAIAAARALGPGTVLVTSAPAMMHRSVATLLVEATRCLQAEHPLVEGAPNGTGDLLAATFLARRLDGMTSEAALPRALGAVFEMVARSVRAGSDELVLAAEQDTILHPMAQVTVRAIATPKPRAK